MLNNILVQELTGHLDNAIAASKSDAVIKEINNAKTCFDAILAEEGVESLETTVARRPAHAALAKWRAHAA